MASIFTMLFRRSFTSKSVPDALWKLGRLNHIAIATPDLSKSASLYKNILGADISEPQHLPDHGVTTIFVNLGNTKLELLHPLVEKSPIQVEATAIFYFYLKCLTRYMFCNRDFWTKTSLEVFTISALKLTIFKTP